MPLTTSFLHRIFAAGLTAFCLTVPSTTATVGEPLKCTPEFKLPTCADRYTDADNTYARDIFVNWIFQLAAYGNTPGRHEMAAMRDRLDWLAGNPDPLGTVIWCTFESLVAIPPDPKKNIYANLVDATAENAARQARFWLAYDLSRSTAQHMLNRIQQLIEASGTIGKRDEDVETFKQHRTDAKCTYTPLLAMSYAALEEENSLVADALDVVTTLNVAVEDEIAHAAEKQDKDKRSLAEQVNQQLHCEVLDPATLGKKSGCGSDRQVMGGQIYDRILVAVQDLSRAFSIHQNEIENAARSINALNADLMAVDRNLRTYTEVFADHKKGNLQERFKVSLAGLRAILAQRGLMGDEIEKVWEPGPGGLRLNPKNGIVNACAPKIDGDRSNSVENAECSYCNIKEPLGPENLEQYLICFHALGVEQARGIKTAITATDTSATTNNRTEFERCVSERELKLGGAAAVDTKQRDEIIAGCFLDWIWGINPVVAAQMEPAFLRREIDD